MHCYQSDYPRPQFVRGPQSWDRLNGPWDFTFDDPGAGLVERWYEKFPQGKTIQVPFNYETPASGIGDQGRHDVVWYHRVVSINKAPAGGRVILHFEGSDYVTMVWVNGRLAGSHQGAYARFSFDVTALVREGDERGERQGGRFI